MKNTKSNNLIMQPLPHDIDAEQAVLGAILIEGQALEKVSLLITPDDFYKDSHKKIFVAMVKMIREQIPIDILTTREYLESKERVLEDVGGSSYLTYLEEVVPTTANVEYYAKLVKEKSIERALCISSMELQQGLTSGRMPYSQAIEKLNETIERISNSHLGNINPLISSTELLKQEADELEWYVDGLIPKSSVILITAPPGLMKTWLAIDIGLGIARGKSCLGRHSRKATVYYIDKENPRGLIKHRLKKLGTDEDFQIWGTWTNLDPPNLDEGLITYRQMAKNDTVIIFDSLVRFHSGEENSSTDMSTVMSSLRQLTKKGTSIIVLHHKGKTDHSYRGSSDILAGVDICYTLTKEDGLLKLGCEAKNRFSQPFTLHLRIEEDYDSFSFKETSSPKQQEDEDGLEQIAAVIRSIINIGGEPYQSKIVDQAKDIGISKSKALELLSRGEGRVWQQVDGKDKNKKIYRLIGNHANADARNAESLREDSLFQFSNTIPPGKQENRKTGPDPWDGVDL